MVKIIGFFFVIRFIGYFVSDANIRKDFLLYAFGSFDQFLCQ